MTYAIRPDNRLDEQLTLCVSARCGVCGQTTTEAGPLWHEAGRIGTTELIEAALSRADGAAACAHPLSRSRGMVVSRYRLPGTARWVGASLELEPGGTGTLSVASVDAALGGPVSGRLEGGDDDFALARLVGQPASLPSAWHGALMAERLGAAADFPCGPHVHMVVAADRIAAIARLACLGVEQEPISIADCTPATPALGPEGWLTEPSSLPHLFAAVDPRGLTAELIDEARSAGLSVQSARGALRLTLRSELLFEDLPLGPVVERALAHARHPRIEAGFSILSIRRQLARRAEVLHAVLRQFEPDDWRMAGDGREVILRRAGEECSLDLSCLAVASPDSLAGLLRSVLEGEGGNPG